MSDSQFFRRFSGLTVLRAPVEKLSRKRHRVWDVHQAIAGRQRLFEVLETKLDSPIIFAGDSITAGCEWRELLGWSTPILNRGIGGDTSLGLLSRIATITKLQPRAVFLMIGHNDIGFSTPAAIAHNVSRILHRIRQDCAQTKIYLQSVLPTRSAKRNGWTRQVNAELRKLGWLTGVSYLHLYDAFLDEAGLLDRRFTNDGAHLSGDAYLMWKGRIGPLVAQLLEEDALAA